MATLPAQDLSVDLRAVTVRPTWGAQEHRRWDRLVAEHHYLPFHGVIGKGLRHVAVHGETWLALIGWSQDIQSSSVRSTTRLMLETPALAHTMSRPPSRSITSLKAPSVCSALVTSSSSPMAPSPGRTCEGLGRAGGAPAVQVGHRNPCPGPLQGRSNGVADARCRPRHQGTAPLEAHYVRHGLPLLPLPHPTPHKRIASLPLG